MKIITWNCNMAFRRKAQYILAHKPDILVIPECEHPARLKFNTDVPAPADILWFGSNPNKGLGIFSYSHFRFRVHKMHNPDLRMIIPITVRGAGEKLMLYAVWANNPHDPDGQYVEQVWKAIHHYGKLISKKATILAGDFNSNTIWDKKYRVGNHSHVVKKLEEKGIHSCYHLHYAHQHGCEMHPTHYLYRHRNKPYHLDYCFASADLAAKISAVEIGDYDYWTKYSDHVPVIVTMNI